MKKQAINKKIRGGGFWGLLLAIVLCASALPAQAETKLKGTIKIDGSSTVFPISEAMAEEFQGANPGVRVTVGISGTGGGFKRFCAGETDISDASRPIKQKEMDACKEKGIQYIELPVAYDGLSVVVNPKNDFVDFLTVAELKKIWEPGSTVKKWSDIRPGWPDREIRLYGPGTDSGTFDYFTETINGKGGASRPDYTASEDDNVLVTGIAGDPDALGYFGYAYYEENSSRLKVVPIDGGSGPITPTDITVQNGTYAPLSRPIFIYVRRSSAGRAEVEAFVRFYLENATELVPQVGYIPFNKAVYQAALDRFHQRKLGSVFAGAKSGARVEDLIKQ